jgi:exonuclease SbcC
MTFVMMIVAIVSGGAWFMATQQAASELGQRVTGILQGQNVEANMLLIAAGGAALLTIIFWLMSSSAKGRAARQKPLAEALVSRLRKVQEIGSPAGDDADKIDRFSERLEAGLATREEGDELVASEQQRLDGEMQLEKDKLANLQQAMEEERSRIAQAEKLNAEKQGLDVKVAEIAHNTKVRETSRMLLKGADDHVVKRFNGDLREFAARTLPLFTGNRYEHLRIEDDLKIRVFSNKKRDFMDLSEISAGTQRQIMLALRLALSRELATTAVKSKQFMFLDEPFAFFDQTRTRDTLKVLLDVSDKITQIWVVNQEFPADQKFALHLVCEDEASELIYPPVSVPSMAAKVDDSPVVDETPAEEAPLPEEKPAEPTTTIL